MEVTLPLNQMSTEDKIRTMEAIWDDLCDKADSMLSPSWHKKFLREREESIQNGDDKFMDWNNAKKHIRDTIS